LTEERLHEAAGRVRALKKQIFGPELATPPPIDVDTAQASMKTGDHTRVADRIAAASLTLVQGTLARPTDRPLIIATRMARRFAAPVEAQINAALAAVGWDEADVLMVDPFPDTHQIARAAEQAAAAGWAALLHFNRVQSFDPESVLISREMVELSSAVADTGVPLSVVSMGSPYALPRFGRATAQICSYSTCDASLYATLRVLQGAVSPGGELPVRLA